MPTKTTGWASCLDLFCTEMKVWKMIKAQVFHGLDALTCLSMHRDTG